MCWTSDSLLFKAGTVLFGGEKPTPTRSKYQTEAHKRYFVPCKNIKSKRPIQIQKLNLTNTKTSQLGQSIKQKLTGEISTQEIQNVLLPATNHKNNYKI